MADARPAMMPWMERTLGVDASSDAEALRQAALSCLEAQGFLPDRNAARAIAAALSAAAQSPALDWFDSHLTDFEGIREEIARVPFESIIPDAVAEAFPLVERHLVNRRTAERLRNNPGDPARPEVADWLALPPTPAADSRLAWFDEDLAKNLDRIGKWRETDAELFAAEPTFNLYLNPDEPAVKTTASGRISPIKALLKPAEPEVEGMEWIIPFREVRKNYREWFAQLKPALWTILIISCIVVVLEIDRASKSGERSVPKSFDKSIPWKEEAQTPPSAERKRAEQEERERLAAEEVQVPWFPGETVEGHRLRVERVKRILDEKAKSSKSSK